MNISKDLEELLQAQVISHEAADKIRGYYRSKEKNPTNRLLIVFGVLGAILVGLGIILIIAHNWDELSRGIKLMFAFLPLIAGQIVCGYVLLKKRDSLAWREGAAAFLFFSVGASISLISQIYNIPGNLSSFLLTWMLLCLPLIYVMKSSIASLVYLVGITYYACETSYWSYPSKTSYLFWYLFAAVLPHYYQLYRNKPESNFMLFHNWLVPLSMVITLGTLSIKAGDLILISYFSLFSCFYLIGNLGFFSRQKVISNGYEVIGFLGTMVMLLALSFDSFWKHLRQDEVELSKLISPTELIPAAIITLLAGALFYLHAISRKPEDIKPLAPVFIFFIITYLIGWYSSVAVVMINLIVFAVGLLTIREGARKDHLGILNAGLLIITALVICRFFDTNLSFVTRGILFVSVGAGFFVINYWILNRRRNSHG